MQYLAICSECNKTFYIDESHKQKDNKYLRCPHCNHRMGIPLLGFCPTCGTNMAFRMRFFKDFMDGGKKWTASLPDIANLTGKRSGIFKSFFQDATNMYKGYSGQLPRSRYYGYCCKCGKPSLECPVCHKINHLVAGNPAQGQVFICTSCNRQFVYLP